VFILSAKHGLVSEDVVIEPYEQTLRAMRSSERAGWQEKTMSEVNQIFIDPSTAMLLAGRDYQVGVPDYELMQRPLDGMSMGRRLQFLATQLSPARTELNRLYMLMRRVHAVAPPLPIAEALTVLRSKAINSGVYFFFDPTEVRAGSKELRVVRVGTHAVSNGSKSSIADRLRTHLGTQNGYGQHRSSIFRSHAGVAIAHREAKDLPNTWGDQSVVASAIDPSEKELEYQVSKWMNSLLVSVLPIADLAGPASDRSFVERVTIGLLSGAGACFDPPSDGWLGLRSDKHIIRRSGLWNLDHVSSTADVTKGLDVMEDLVSAFEVGTVLRESTAGDWHHTHATTRQGRLFI
jgi:hypothetical protein